ncbi:MAG: hypothetical protein JSV08_03745 [Acidobacteriota bacterium]|nr:MAG: hypothetical protein JSV08_03745 [Acidobacteriota bacterium]
MRKRSRFIGFFVFLLAFGFSAVADVKASPEFRADDSFMPGMPNHGAAFLWFLNPFHQPTHIPPSGSLELSSYFYRSSHYVGVVTPRHQLFQHAEISSLYLGARYGLSARTALDAEMPLHTTSTNRLRGLFHRKQLYGKDYFFTVDDREAFRASPGRLYAGDLSLGASARFRRADGYLPEVVARGAVEIPTGDDGHGFGNGRLDYGLTLALRWAKRHGRLASGYVRFHVVLPGNLARAPGVPVRSYWGANAGFHTPMPWPRSMRKRWVLSGNIFWNTSPIGPEVQIRTLSARSFGLGGSLFYRASERTRVEFVLMEDFTDRALGQQDFLIGAGVRHRFQKTRGR